MKKNIFFVLVMSFICYTVSAQSDNKKEPVSYEEYNQAIKVRPLAPLGGVYEIGYEIGGFGKNANKSIEANLAYISTPLLYAPFLKNNAYQVNGARVRIGGKLYFSSQEFTVSGTRRTHPMFGNYIKAELSSRYMLSNARYQSDVSIPVVVQTTQSFMGALTFILGRQFVIDRFCVDVFGGIGYAYKKQLKTVNGDAVDPYYFYLPISTELGFRLGYLFRDSKQNK